LAEFTLEPPGGGHAPGPGGLHPKKGMKINKPMIYIGGAVIIILFLVIRGRSGGSAQDTGVAETSVNYPSNSVDVAGQLQNNSDILMGQVQQQLTQFQTGLAADQLEQQKAHDADQKTHDADQLAQQKSYADKLKEISDKMGSMSGAIDLLNSHPAPANNTPPPAPAHAPAPAPAPAQLKPESAGIVYHVPQKGWTGTSIVDYLKSKGLKNDFASRTKLAGQMGIINYNGTAAQNTALLNKLRG
jgi:hypothetical protein